MSPRSHRGTGPSGRRVAPGSVPTVPSGDRPQWMQGDPWGCPHGPIGGGAPVDAGWPLETSQPCQGWGHSVLSSLPENEGLLSTGGLVNGRGGQPSTHTPVGPSCEAPEGGGTKAPGHSVFVQGINYSAQRYSSTTLNMKMLSKSFSTQSPTRFSSKSDGSFLPEWPSLARRSARSR